MTTAIKVSVREQDNCVILDVQAPSLTYPHAGTVKAEVMGLITQGKRNFVMNMAQVESVDSFGLASIVAALKLIKDAHGHLALFGINELFAKLVKLTHLHNVLEIWETEPQAVYYLSTLK